MVLSKMASLFLTDLSVIEESDELYNKDVDTRDEGPFAEDSALDQDMDTGYEGPGDQDPVSSSNGDTEEDSSSSDGETDTDESCCSDPDSDPALRYCHKDEVAYRRSNGLEFPEESGAGFWYRPGGVRFFDCYQLPKGVVFEDD